ncbi:glutamate synthase-related protein [Thermodesulfobacteriota bacterium]
MPSKYAVHTKPVANRFEAVTKSGVIAWEEGCLKCAVCVKTRCVYGVYEKRGLDPNQMIDSIDNLCMNCFRCVQGCPKELIHKSENPEYNALGDSYWTPDIIAKLWYQAETGKIPVSGAGYPGPFSGPGFDSMWTDMSEIVRPTRDGIHGREYISTAIDLGRIPPDVVFTEEGLLEQTDSDLIDIPLPMILRMPSFGALSTQTVKGWAMVAQRLKTFLAIPEEMISPDLAEYSHSLIPIISSKDLKKGSKDSYRIIEIPWQEDMEAVLSEMRSNKDSYQTMVRLPIAEGVEERALYLAEQGVGIIHLEGTLSGKAVDDDSLAIKDAIRSVHLELVEKGVRGEVTIIAGGGFAMAEHVAKGIICGTDGIFVDFPALIALECRMCRRCTKGLSCPVQIDKAKPSWVAARILNLIGAWHNQLLEVMGAMGIRDARRLRGESGRAMFFEDLDKAIFGSMGQLEEDCELE